MAFRERLKELGQEAAMRTVGAPVTGTDGRRVARLFVRDGKTVLIYDTTGKHIVDHTDDGLDSLGAKGGGNAYLNLAATADPTKIGRA